MTKLDELKKLIDESESLVVLTGAGVSTGSGIPDFRGKNGVWTKDPDAERLSDIRYFKSDPAIREKHWANTFYSDMENMEPCDTHYAIARLKPKAIITQNIDGLHQKADPAARVLEMHGTARTSSCMQCDRSFFTATVLKQMADSGVKVPLCPCGGILKRDIVMFGEMLNESLTDEAIGLAVRSDVFLCVGSTLSVHPVGSYPFYAQNHGSVIVVINDGATDFDGHADLKFSGNAYTILKEL